MATPIITFGTAGARGVMGRGANCFNRQTIWHITGGVSKYFKDHFGRAIYRGVIIAYDNRMHSREFAEVAAQCLAEAGIRVYMFPAPRPTPELSFAIPFLRGIGGIMITASHNSKEYNGYKVYDQFGSQLLPDETVLISDNIAANAFPHWPWHVATMANSNLIQTLSDEIDVAYQAQLAGLYRSDVNSHDTTVVYTPLHGVGDTFIPQTLQELGFRTYVVSEQADRDPAFTTVSTPNPECRSVYNYSLRYAYAYDADVILATDPDGDRLGVMIRAYDGTYKLLTGSQLGAVLLYYLIYERYEAGTHVYSSETTTSLIPRICQDAHVKHICTPVGFKYIGSQVGKLTTPNSFLFGCEESCGYLIQPFTHDKDGAQASILTAEAVAYYKSQGYTLLDILDTIYKKYGFYNDIQINIDSDRFRCGDAMIKLSNGLSSLYGTHVSMHSGTVMCELNTGRIVLRQSGTESRIKAYIEGHGADHDSALAASSQLLCQFVDLFHLLD